MSANMQHLLSRWALLRTFLLRYPLADLIIAYELIGFGALALTLPDAVVHHSHFSKLHAVISIIGSLALAIGLYDGWAAIRNNMRHRRIAAALSLFILLGLSMAVDSVTGRIAWSGHTITAFLICLAVVR